MAWLPPEYTSEVNVGSDRPGGQIGKVPVALKTRAARKLEYVDLDTRLDDLKVPPGNQLHALGGDRKGQHATLVNDQRSICFCFSDGDSYDVEFCDYHQ